MSHSLILTTGPSNKEAVKFPSPALARYSDFFFFFGRLIILRVAMLKHLLWLPIACYGPKQT